MSPVTNKDLLMILLASIGMGFLLGFAIIGVLVTFGVQL